MDLLYASAAGTDTVAVGEDASASGSGATALGSEADASGRNSVASDAGGNLASDGGLLFREMSRLGGHCDRHGSGKSRSRCLRELRSRRQYWSLGGQRCTWIYRCRCWGALGAEWRRRLHREGRFVRWPKQPKSHRRPGLSSAELLKQRSAQFGEVGTPSSISRLV